MFLRNYSLALSLLLYHLFSPINAMDQDQPSCCKTMVSTVKSVMKLPSNLTMCLTSGVDVPILFTLAMIESPCRNYLGFSQKFLDDAGLAVFNVRPYFIAKILRGDCKANVCINPFSFSIQRQKNSWVKFYLDHGSNANGQNSWLCNKVPYWETAIYYKNFDALKLLCQAGLSEQNRLEALRFSMMREFTEGIDILYTESLGLNMLCILNSDQVIEFLDGIPKLSQKHFLSKVLVSWELFRAYQICAKDKTKKLHEVLTELMETEEELKADNQKI
jgi:hypothetical protein